MSRVLTVHHTLCKNLFLELGQYGYKIKQSHFRVDSKKVKLL
jgi:hypothetical protein